MDNRRTFLVSLGLVLLCGRVMADGGFFALEGARWRQVEEKQQTCFISYNAGCENMLLAVKLDSFHSTKAAWIFPVPASPDNVAIDVVPDLPDYYGVSAGSLGRQAIAHMFSFMAMTQLYPIPFMGEGSSRTRDRGWSGLSYGAMPPMMGSAGDVEVYRHVEKLGLTTELIAARDKDAPYAYLKQKGLDLPEEARAILGDYAGGNYSFVVSWISDSALFKPDTGDEWRYEPRTRQVAVSVSFPTGAVYFPLKLSRVYGPTRIPIEVNVLGYVTPEISAALKPFTTTDYKIHDNFDVPPALTSFFNDRERIEHLRYTTISIKAPAKRFEQDLRITNAAPRRVAVADWLHRSFPVFVLVAFTIATLLAGILSAAAAFPNDRAARTKFALLGLLNFATFAAVLVGAALVRTRRQPGNPGPEPASPGKWDLRKLLYAVLFAFLFMGITLIYSLVLRALI